MAIYSLHKRGWHSITASRYTKDFEVYLFCRQDKHVMKHKLNFIAFISTYTHPQEGEKNQNKQQTSNNICGQKIMAMKDKMSITHFVAHDCR